MRGPLLAFIILLAASCALPTQVRPARVLEKGEGEGAVAIDATFRNPYFPSGERRSLESFMGASLQGSIRYGLWQGFEVGGDLGFGYLRAGGRSQVVRSRFLDLALGWEAGALSAKAERGRDAAFMTAFPLNLGWNISPGFSILGLGAPSYWMGEWMFQVGGGVDIRVGDSFALRPFVSSMVPLQGREDEGFWGSRGLVGFGLELATFGNRGYHDAGH